MAKPNNFKGSYTLYVPENLVLSPAYRDLSTQARSLLIEFIRIYRPSRNGHLSISTRQAIEWLNISKETANKVFYELASHGFIKLAGLESWTQGKARTWYLTCREANNREATNEWMHWQPNANLCPLPTRSSKNKMSTPKQGAVVHMEIGQAGLNKRSG